MSIVLGVVQTIAHQKTCLGFVARVVRFQCDLAALIFVNEGADFNRAGIELIQMLFQIGHRQSGIENVLDDEDVPVSNIDLEILE